MAIFIVYKQVLYYLNFANHRTKESFVSTANKPLVGTLMTIGDVTVSIAIYFPKFTFNSKTLSVNVTTFVTRYEGKCKYFSFIKLDSSWKLALSRNVLTTL